MARLYGRELVYTTQLYLAASMGGENVPLSTYDNPRFRGMKIDYKSESASTGTIKLWDETSFYIEGVLLMSDYLVLSYNMTPPEGETSYHSPMCKLTIVDYKTSYGYNGVEVELSVCFAGQESIESRNLEFKGYRIDEIVQYLADLEKWKVASCAKTDEILEERAFSGSTQRIFWQNDKDSATFIKDELLPFAKSGDKPFTFALVINSSGENVVYFEPIAPLGNKADKTLAWDLGSTDSDVLEATFEYVALPLIKRGAKSYSISTLDPSTNTAVNITSGDPSAVATASKNMASANRSQATAIADTMRKRAAIAQFTAKIKLVGNKAYDVMSTVKLLPKQKDGVLHYAAGVYKIINVTHTLESGILVFDLTLVREATEKAEETKK